ncbi:MAG: YdcH family protein [Acidobacteria bacterium]|nr:YdcH family protein [Acidobacteriota bacterium]
MNAEEAQTVKVLLLQHDNGYRQLAAQHNDLDHRLHELSDKPYLSTSEQIEEVTLKKRKLALKDRMEEMARAYVDVHSPPS